MLLLSVRYAQVVVATGEAVEGGRDVGAGAQVNVQAALDWRDYMVSDYSDAGQERWRAERRIAFGRGVGRLAGLGAVEVNGIRHSVSSCANETGGIGVCLKPRLFVKRLVMRFLGISADSERSAGGWSVVLVGRRGVSAG